jgi:hypothetical protein
MWLEGAMDDDGSTDSEGASIPGQFVGCPPNKEQHLVNRTGLPFRNFVVRKAPLCCAPELWKQLTGVALAELVTMSAVTLRDTKIEIKSNYNMYLSLV